MKHTLLLLALALAGCEGEPAVPIWMQAQRDIATCEKFLQSYAAIAQADPRTEADWPRLGLTVTNGTPRHLLLEQGDRVTLAQPDSSYTLPAGAITIREAREYDD